MQMYYCRPDEPDRDKKSKKKTASSPCVALASIVAEHGVYGPLVHHEVERARLERKAPRVENLHRPSREHKAAASQSKMTGAYRVWSCLTENILEGWGVCLYQ